MADFQLGQRVAASDTLTRRIFHERPKNWVGVIRRKRWVRNREYWPNSRAHPVAGIVVGIRSLHEIGTADWEGEEVGYTWVPDRDSRRTAVLIAFDINRAPVYAWPEDVTIIEEGGPHVGAAAADPGAA